MTAKDYLLQYKLVNAKIERVEQNLKEIREERAAISVNLDGMPRGTDLSERTAKLAVKIADMECELIDMRSEAWSIRMDIIKTLGKLTNPTHFTLLHFRYIDGYKWERIAVEMNYSYQWVAETLHKNSLNELQQILDRN